MNSNVKLVKSGTSYIQTEDWGCLDDYVNTRLANPKAGEEGLEKKDLYKQVEFLKWWEDSNFNVTRKITIDNAKRVTYEYPIPTQIRKHPSQHSCHPQPK